MVHFQKGPNEYCLAAETAGVGLRLDFRGMCHLSCPLLLKRVTGQDAHGFAPSGPSTGFPFWEAAYQFRVHPNPFAFNWRRLA